MREAGAVIILALWTASGTERAWAQAPARVPLTCNDGWVPGEIRRCEQEQRKLRNELQKAQAGARASAPPPPAETTLAVHQRTMTVARQHFRNGHRVVREGVQRLVDSALALEKAVASAPKKAQAEAAMKELLGWIVPGSDALSRLRHAQFAALMTNDAGDVARVKALSGALARRFAPGALPLDNARSAIRSRLAGLLEAKVAGPLSPPFEATRSAFVSLAEAAIRFVDASDPLFPREGEARARYGKIAGQVNAFIEQSQRSLLKLAAALVQ